MILIYPISPVAKPRMTVSDKWKQRPAVLKYRAFSDEVRLYKVPFPESGAHIIFHIPMPESWSKKKMAEMVGKSHQQTPDLDNLVKALADACCKRDEHLNDYRVSKVWGYKGSIEIRENVFDRVL